MANLQPPATVRRRRSDLLPRAIVGGVLIAVALLAVWLGGWPFVALVAAATLLVFAEWAVMHRIGRSWRFAGLLLVAGVCVATQLGFTEQAGAVLLLVAAALAIAARLGGTSGRWMATGLLYAGLPAIALVWLRKEYGIELVVWLLAVVWATDICAYFAGRAIGGPRIAPRISPNKTWAGLVGGMVGAAIVSAVLMPYAYQPLVAMRGVFAAIGAGLAVVAQAGDFYESWLKRRVGIKDSGTLLPGHGGIMDRIDGLVPVAVVIGVFFELQDWLH